jgi:hypothetical protein
MSYNNAVCHRQYAVYFVPCLGCEFIPAVQDPCVKKGKYIAQYKKYIWNFACLYNWHNLYAVVSMQEANHNILVDHKVHLYGSQSRKLILKEREHLIKCDDLEQVFTSKLLCFLLYLLWSCYALRVKRIVVSDFYCGELARWFRWENFECHLSTPHPIGGVFCGVLT